MIIEYELTPADFEAFGRFHYAHAKAMRRQTRRLMVFFAGLWFLFALLSMLGGSPGEGAIWVIGGAAIVLFVPRFIRWHAARNARRVAMEGLGHGSVGPHVLEVLETGLADRTAFYEYLTRWPGVEGISATDTHFFVYVGTHAALLVPKAAFATVDQQMDFQEAIDAHIAVGAA